MAIKGQWHDLGALNVPRLFECGLFTPSLDEDGKPYESTSGDVKMIGENGYEGQADRDGIPHGFNLCFYLEDSLLYEGMVDRRGISTIEDEKNGFGRLIDGKDNVWIGHWVKGKMHGFGVH